jgi:hypothetical protein
MHPAAGTARVVQDGTSSARTPGKRGGRPDDLNGPDLEEVPRRGCGAARMTPAELDRQADTLALINDDIAGRLDRQAASLDKIDNKAVVVVGYALAAASFLATRNSQPVLAGLAFGAFAVAAVFGVLALAVWNYQDTEPVALVQYVSVNRGQALAAMIANRTQIFAANSRRQRVKARQWWISISVLLLGTALMVAAILVHTTKHDRADSTAGTAAVSVYGGRGPAGAPPD